MHVRVTKSSIRKRERQRERNRERERRKERVRELETETAALLPSGVSSATISNTHMIPSISQAVSSLSAQADVTAIKKLVWLQLLCLAHCVECAVCCAVCALCVRCVCAVCVLCVECCADCSNHCNMMHSALLFTPSTDERISAAHVK